MSRARKITDSREAAWAPRGRTDTSRDHDFTNWKAIDQIVDELVRELPERATAAREARPSP